MGAADAIGAAAGNLGLGDLDPEILAELSDNLIGNESISEIEDMIEALNKGEDDEEESGNVNARGREVDSFSGALNSIRNLAEGAMSF